MGSKGSKTSAQVAQVFEQRAIDERAAEVASRSKGPAQGVAAKENYNAPAFRPRSLLTQQQIYAAPPTGGKTLLG